MEVPSGAHSPVQVPGNGVNHSGFNVDAADRANPNLAGLSPQAIGLLHLKLRTALSLSAWQGKSDSV
jgi:hypothetical protein